METLRKPIETSALRRGKKREDLALARAPLLVKAKLPEKHQKPFRAPPKLVSPYSY